MAKIKLQTEVAKNAGVSKKVIKTLNVKDKVSQSKAAVNYIMSKIQTDDATLYAAMDKTVAEATAELAQLPNKIKSDMVTNNPTGFFCSFNTTIPFIYNNGRIISFDRTNAAEEKPFATLFAEAMGAYMASKLASSIITKINSTTDRSKVSRGASASLSLVDTKIASIVSTY
tara:strand:- start:1918 stop:2433 length:516 start_codon:yes stop_codon:yes gene_type:complete